MGIINLRKLKFLSGLAIEIIVISYVNAWGYTGIPK